MLDEIPEADWIKFVDERMAGNKPITRESFISSVMAFLNSCKKRPRKWVGQLPAFERDPKARNPRQGRARRVGELRPELIALLIEHAPPHYKGQTAVHWSTGARVSSIIYGCRYCDYLAVEGREQITFHKTKPGIDVTAVVHPWAAAVMRDYLEWRGVPKDREEPLFLTHMRRPYTNNGKSHGGQTKGAFGSMVRRASASLRRMALRQAAELRRQGRRPEARALWAAAQADIALLAQLTPHWFRHLLATTMMAEGDLRSTMEQGGWLDVRSVLAYMHDVPSRRRGLVGRMAAPVFIDGHKGHQNSDGAVELVEAELAGPAATRQPPLQATRPIDTSSSEQVITLVPRQGYVATTEGTPMNQLEPIAAEQAIAKPPLSSLDKAHSIVLRRGRIASVVLAQINQDEYEVRKGGCVLGVVAFFNGHKEWGWRFLPSLPGMQLDRKLHPNAEACLKGRFSIARIWTLSSLEPLDYSTKRDRIDPDAIDYLRRDTVHQIAD